MDQLDGKSMQVLKNLLSEMSTKRDDQGRLSNSAVDVMKLDQTSVSRVSRIDTIQQQGIAFAIQNTAKR